MYWNNALLCIRIMHWNDVLEKCIGITRLPVTRWVTNTL